MLMNQEMNNSLNFETSTEQYIFDAFNEFIFSPDRRVLGKLIARTFLFNQIKDVPGDIVECGVYKGAGILSFLKIKNILAPNSFKKVIGFDYFDTDSLLSSLSGKDQIHMKEIFERGYQHDEMGEALQFLHEKIHSAGFGKNDYELIQGNVSETAKEFVSKRPGLKISLLVIDVDVAQATYDALSAFWDRVSVGGLVVFDEYGYHAWSEAQGADRFFGDKNVQIKALDYPAPCAYVVKG